MRVAVTYENGQVFQHFGHTEWFKVYDITDEKAVFTSIINTNGSGHGALAGLLNKLEADTLICGGIGGGAKTALSEAKIELYAGVSGDADKAVEDLISGKLEHNTEATCNHHGEHHNHGESCGDHGCGSHEHHSCH